MTINCDAGNYFNETLYIFEIFGFSRFDSLRKSYKFGKTTGNHTIVVKLHIKQLNNLSSNQASSRTQMYYF